VLWKALTGARAWEALNDPARLGKMNAEEFLETARAAGWPEAQAQKAASHHAAERLRRNLDP